LNVADDDDVCGGGRGVADEVMSVGIDKYKEDGVSEDSTEGEPKCCCDLLLLLLLVLPSPPLLLLILAYDM
jgi:hypothetical protein